MIVGDGTARPEPHRPRNSRELLGDPVFSAVFWARLVMLTAVWAFIMTTVILAFEFSGSATWAGAVAAAQMLPQFAFTLPGGRLSDKYGALPLIIIGTTTVGSGVLGLVLWLALWPGGGEAGVLALVASSLLFGSGLALATPALQAIVPKLVRPDELPAAAGLSFIPTTLARAVGPVLGALLLNILGPVAAFLVIGLATMATLLCYLPVRRLMVSAGTGKMKDLRWRPVFVQIARDRILLTAMVGVAVIGAGAEAAITLAPVIADDLGEASAGGSVITAGFGLGGLLGILALRLARKYGTPSLQGAVAMMALGLAVVLAGGGQSLAVVAAVLTLGGAGMVAGVTAFSTALQLQCPPAMLGRVMAVWVLAFSGVRPFAALLMGAIADEFTSTAALWGSGVVMALTAVVLFIVSRRTPGADVVL